MGILMIPSPSVQIVPQKLYGDEAGLYSGTILLFARKFRELWLHVAGHCPAVKSADVSAREGLQRGGGFHPCDLLLSLCHL